MWTDPYKEITSFYVHIFLISASGTQIRLKTESNSNILLVVISYIHVPESSDWKCQTSRHKESNLSGRYSISEVLFHFLSFLTLPAPNSKLPLVSRFKFGSGLWVANVIVAGDASRFSRKLTTQLQQRRRLLREFVLLWRRSKLWIEQVNYDCVFCET